METPSQKKDFGGFATFKELLAWLKKTPPVIVDLTSAATRFQN